MAAARSPRRSSGSDTTATSARRQTDQLLLDLLGADVLAAPDDDVGHPVGDGEVAVVVQHADVAGAVPARLVEGAGGELRVGVAKEQVGTTARCVAVLVEPHLHPGEPHAVGGEALRFRVVDRAPRDRRVLGAAVGAVHLDPVGRQALGDGQGKVEPPMPAIGILASWPVESGWSSTLYEEGGAAPQPDVLRAHDPEHFTRIQTSSMWMGWSRRRGRSRAFSMPMKCPTGAPVRVGAGWTWSSTLANRIKGVDSAAPSASRSGNSVRWPAWRPRRTSRARRSGTSSGCSTPCSSRCSGTSPSTSSMSGIPVRCSGSCATRTSGWAAAPPSSSRACSTTRTSRPTSSRGCPSPAWAAPPFPSPSPSA